MAVAALMMNVMQMCNIQALRLADYSFFVGFSYLRLPIIAILALVLFGEVPDIWILPGGAMIIGAAIYVAVRERKLAATSAQATQIPAQDPQAATIVDRKTDGL